MTPGRLTDLAFAHHHLDRLTEQRGEPGLVDSYWVDPRARVLLLFEDTAPIRDGQLRYASPADVDPDLERHFLGLGPDGRAYFAVFLPRRPESGAPTESTPSETPSETPTQSGSTERYVGLRQASLRLDPMDGAIFAHALALENWHRTHPFCSTCGAPTVLDIGGHIRRCESCGALHFPRTDPAIIVLVTDADDRALLGRGATWEAGRFSTLAGFVEPAESLEDAVIREVHEETGVVVTEPTYAGSQPWPFPCSLMLGFFARATSTEIHVDGTEVAEARWYSREGLRQAYDSGELALSPSVSISRRLIEAWYGAPLE